MEKTNSKTIGRKSFLQALLAAAAGIFTFNHTTRSMEGNAPAQTSGEPQVKSLKKAKGSIARKDLNGLSV